MSNPKIPPTTGTASADKHCPRQSTNGWCDACELFTPCHAACRTYPPSPDGSFWVEWYENIMQPAWCGCCFDAFAEAVSALGGRAQFRLETPVSRGRADDWKLVAWDSTYEVRS